MVASPALAAEESPLAVAISSPAEAFAAPAVPPEQPPVPVVVRLNPEALGDSGFLDPLLACATERRLEIVALIEPPVAWREAPDPYEAVGTWLSDIEGFALRLGGRI